MRTKYNELSIGITVSLATLLVVFGILLLGKSSVLVHGTLVNVVVQNADGLGTGDEVWYRGISTGTVQSIDLKPEGVLAVLKLHGSPRIPVDSQFVIKDASLLGGKIVEIEAGTSSEILAPNATVQGRSENGLLGLTSGTSDLSQHVADILANVDKLSGDKTTANLVATLENLNATTRALRQILAENNAQLSETVDNLHDVSVSASSAMSNIDKISSENKEPIKQAISSIDDTSQQLAAAIKQTQETVDQLNTMLAALQKGQGSLGKLMVDDTLYNQMQKTAEDLDSLVTDIKANPQRYVTVKIF